MTLPASGAISLSAVNTELTLSSTALITLNDANVRELFRVFTGPISLNDGHGKTWNFAFALTTQATGSNLRTRAVAAGWDGHGTVTATVPAGNTLASTSTGTPALTIDGVFLYGVKLINQGTIVGRGATGGVGAHTSSTTGVAGPAPTSGGIGLVVSIPLVTVDNTGGTIAAGGGGGGGGGASGYSYSYNYFAGKICSHKPGCTDYFDGSTMGSGGGGGSGNGPGGSAGSPGYGSTITPGNVGLAGGVLTGGTGGTAVTSSGPGGDGGAGGAYSTGGNGTNLTGSDGATSGSLAGACISGNSNITWLAFGTRFGSIV